LGAEIGELMHRQDTIGGNSLRGSSASQGCSTNGIRRGLIMQSGIGHLTVWYMIMNVLEEHSVSSYRSMEDGGSVF
jgi:hypothetical protein